MVITQRKADSVTMVTVVTIKRDGHWLQFIKTFPNNTAILCIIELLLVL